MKCCFRCGHYFNHKSNLNRHLSRKMPCTSKYLDVQGLDILNDFIHYKQQFEVFAQKNNLTQFIDKDMEPENPYILETDIPKLNNNNNNNAKIIISESSDEEDLADFDSVEEDFIYKCEGCKQVFKYKNNYYRHRKSACTVLKDEHKQLKKFKKNLDKTYRTLKKEHQDKKVVNNDYKFNDESNNSQYHNQLDNSLNSYNTTAHNFQLKQGTRDIINQNEFNITINEYGNEDVNGISNHEWKQIVKKLYYALPDLVKKVHFDIENNRNVYVPNIREKYAMVWKNGDWEMMDIRDVLNDLLVNNTDRIYEFLEENEGDIGDTLHSKMNSIIEKIGNSKKLQKKYQDQIKMILINNRSVVKKSYEAESGKKLEVR